MTKLVDELGGLAREIVAKRLAIVAAVTAAVSVAASYGWITPGVGDYATSWITRALDALGVIVGVFWARQGVTPADPALAPTSAHGAPFIEAGTTNT